MDSKYTISMFIILKKCVCHCSNVKDVFIWKKDQHILQDGIFIIIVENKKKTKQNRILPDLASISSTGKYKYQN